MLKTKTTTEQFTVHGFVDKDGHDTTYQDCTIVLVMCADKIVLPFCKSELCTNLNVGDKFVIKSEIIPIDSTENVKLTLTNAET
jgi:hypothetical protein